MKNVDLVLLQLKSSLNRDFPLDGLDVHYDVLNNKYKVRFSFILEMDKPEEPKSFMSQIYTFWRSLRNKTELVGTVGKYEM